MVASEALQKGLGCFGLFATLNKERGDVLFMEMPPTPGVQTAPQATKCCLGECSEGRNLQNGC